MVYFFAFGEVAPATVFVPPVYRELIGHIYGVHGIPRTLAPTSVREPDGLAGRTNFDVQFLALVRAAIISLKSFGSDFTDSLQRLFARLDREGYQLTVLRLPLGGPVTGFFGAGLSELGVSLSGVLPQYDNGDVLLLSRCTTLVEIEGVPVESEISAELLAAVVADYRRAWDRTESRALARAKLNRSYEAL